MNDMNVQNNITLPLDWREKLKKKALELTVKNNKTITYQDLIRDAIKEKFGLKINAGDVKRGKAI